MVPTSFHPLTSAAERVLRTTARAWGLADPALRPTMLPALAGLYRGHSRSTRRASSTAPQRYL